MKKLTLALALWVPSLVLVLVSAPAPTVAQQCGWSPLGSGLGDIAFALTVFDDGTGLALYAGGRFDTADGMPQPDRQVGWHAMVTAG